MAFSCTTLLSSVRPDLIVGNIEQAEKYFNACFVQGYFTLLAYANQFWAYHVRAFLKYSHGQQGKCLSYLITELETLTRVYKDQSNLLRTGHNGPDNSSNSRAQSNHDDLPQLANYANLQTFLRDYAQFQNVDKQKQQSFPTVQGNKLQPR
jgi:hypothetical protein